MEYDTYVDVVRSRVHRRHRHAGGTRLSIWVRQTSVHVHLSATSRRRRRRQLRLHTHAHARPPLHFRSTSMTSPRSRDTVGGTEPRDSRATTGKSKVIDRVVAGYVCRQMAPDDAASSEHGEMRPSPSNTTHTTDHSQTELTAASTP